MKIKARCTCGPTQGFQATTIERRAPGPHDVVIDIAYAGICHSDIDHARSTRGQSMYPLVPGHEIAGTIAAVGPAVTRFTVGDRAGVGNLIDSCRECDRCRAGLEQYCPRRTLTYNTIDRYGQRTHGGYSEKIVVDERFAVRIPDAMPLANAAPMFCAGITLYSPLKHWRAGPGKRVGIMGFGGLGHVGVQIAKALGAHVTVFELSAAKHEDAHRFGADAFHTVDEPALFKDLASALDLIISTVPANVDMDAWLGLLAVDGVFVNLSIPSKPLTVSSAALAANRRSISGTRSGGIPETQEMLEFCAAHGINAQVEVIGADDIDAAYERLLAGDVRYRFVIDIQTMAEG